MEIIFQWIFQLPISIFDIMPLLFDDVNVDVHKYSSSYYEPWSHSEKHKHKYPSGDMIYDYNSAHFHLSIWLCLCRIHMIHG